MVKVLLCSKGKGKSRRDAVNSEVRRQEFNGDEKLLISCCFDIRVLVSLQYDLRPGYIYLNSCLLGRNSIRVVWHTSQRTFFVVVGGR